MQAFLQAVTDDPNAAPLVIMSSVKSVMTPINSVILDSRFDVQRRRAYSQQIDSAATAVIT